MGETGLDGHIHGSCASVVPMGDVARRVSYWHRVGTGSIHHYCAGCWLCLLLVHTRQVDDTGHGDGNGMGSAGKLSWRTEVGY